MPQTNFIQGSDTDWTEFANAVDAFEAANCTAKPAVFQVSSTKPAAAENRGLPLLYGGVVARSFAERYWFRGDVTIAVTI